MRNHLLASALVVASVFPATVSFARQSTVYASVLSTRLFVVGAPNPSTGLFFQNPPDDTLWRHSGRNNIRAFGLAVHAPSRGQLIYIASGNGAHRTTDGGASWKISTGWNITEVLGVAIDPKNPNNVYLCTAYGMFKTTDGGEHWREMNGGLSARFVSSIVIDHSNSDIVFCSTEDGVYRSDAGGRDWKRTGLNVGGVRILTQHPQLSEILFAGTENHGIFITRNGGTSWEKIEAGLDHQTFYTIAFDPGKPDTMYAGGFATGVYKSVDGGKNWKRTSNGLTNLNVHSIAVNPTNGNQVYAATMWSGIFRSDNAGDTWRNAGLDGSQVWTITIQPF
ncbi:MAG TPA: hypothetical protein DCP63_07520 [Bacteroidetes bacterium]|nr:hypothetical protein [Bacteroidota bacterium]